MHKEIEKLDMGDICAIEKDLISVLRTVTAHGVFSKEVEKDELGALVDMVKDMAETKRNCMEAHYYEKVCKAMDEYEDEEDRSGYNPNRYSSGRYAPKGHGNYTAGFRPMIEDGKRIPEYYRDVMGEDLFPGMMPMGYSEKRDDRDNMPNKQNRSGETNPRMQYGEAYMEYDEARRHYTSTKSAEDKDRMDEKALEHLDRSIMTIRDIWKGADASLRKEMKASLMALIQDMPT